MNLDSTVSLGSLLLSLGVVLISSGIAWGGLLARVRALERQVEKLENIPERLAAIETAARNTEAMVTRLLERVMDEPRSFTPPKGDERR